LVPEQMGIDALCNPGGSGVLLDDLSEPPGRVGSAPVGREQMDGALPPLIFHVWREFPAEACGEQHITIFVSLALGDAQLTGLQIPIGDAEPREFGIAYPRKE
jgi:hypothetical protein